MKNFHNIETVKYHGYYRAYGKDGSIWQVRGSSGAWMCYPHNKENKLFCCKTLSEVSLKLESI
jgi:hypothetical protein